MLTVHRLKAGGLGLAVLAAATCAYVWGDASGGRKPTPPTKLGVLAEAIKTDGPSVVKRFDKPAATTYQSKDGETLFGLPVQPKLDAPAAWPRDVVVLIDTSASQAGKPYTTARRILASLAAAASPDDRFAVWTVNTPDSTADLTGGLRGAKDPAFQAALTALEKGYASGAADLKSALSKALAKLDLVEGRRPVVLYLGDGESAYRPVTDDERTGLIDGMVSKQVGFFAVPLGLSLNSKNLHGLTTGTGGLVVRVTADESDALVKLDDYLAPGGKDKLKAEEEARIKKQADEVVHRVVDAVDAPVLYPTKHAFAGEVVAESFPSRLPPLRSDSPTLIVGRFAKATPAVELAVEGSVQGKPAKVTVSLPVQAPELDNYFLISMVGQWKHSGKPEVPALVRADRALAFAYEQTRMSRDEYLTLADWALASDRLDDAERLYRTAQVIDPRETDAEVGVSVVRNLREGKITRQQLKDQFRGADETAVMVGKVSRDKAVQTVRGRLKELVSQLGADDKPKAPPADPKEPAPVPAPSPVLPPEGGNLLEQERRRQALRDQAARQEIDDTVRAARREAPVSPDSAIERLKLQRDTIREDNTLSPAVKTQLLGNLETALRDISRRSADIKRRQEEERERAVRARLRSEREREAAALEDRTRERIRAFTTLMNQARYQEAYREALVLQQEAISKGTPVPVEATAAYNMSLNAANLREVQELRRIREERFLITMLQVEKSHIPYPDEPPVHFPPAKVWQDLTAFRKDRYSSTTLGTTGITPRTYQLRDALNRVVTIDRPIEKAALKDVLEFLTDKYDITFLVDDKAFKAGGVDAIMDQQVTLPKLAGVTLGTVLKLLIGELPQGEYIINRDYIVITTRKALSSPENKAVRVYDVADLIIPIPSAVNTLGLQQNLQVLGQTFSFNSQGGVGGFNIGGFNLGGINLGGINLGGFNLGGLNAGLNLGLNLGGVGGGAQGFQGNQFNGQGFQVGGAQNLGFGGGLQGFGGGQLGQFGNLGGQFGIQGGDQSSILVTLIRDVVARGEWAIPGQLTGGVRQPPGGDPAEPGEEDPKLLAPEQLNSLGYYPPARALVVRATSRLHTRYEFGVGGAGAAPPPAAALPGVKDGAIVVGPKRNDNLDKLADIVGNKKDPKKPGEEPKKPGEETKKPDDTAVAGKSKDGKHDPKKVWQQMLDRFARKDGGLKDPGMIIAGADFLFQTGEFEHAAEFLKADLRRGHLTDPCVFEALAVALKATGASTSEIERARVSSIDLEPKSARAYLKASEAADELGKTEAALSFCRQSAALEPDAPDPYANALVYLDRAKAVDTDAARWAAGNLLNRDWALGGKVYHEEAKAKLARLESKLLEEKRPADARQLKESLAGQQERDIEIEMSYSGDADLDLYVTEPTGQVCSVLRKETAGGGVLRGDDPTRQTEVYTAATAFSGSYVIKASRVWGTPQAGKATVLVTRHKGAASQSRELFTLDLSKGEAEVKVFLADGRRTTAAAPPAISRPAANPNVSEPSGPDSALNKLRAMTDPYAAPGSRSMRAGVGSMNSRRPGKPDADENGPVTLSTRVPGERVSTVDLSMQTTVAPDGSVRMTLAPVFQTGDKTAWPVNLSLIPGGR